MISNYVAKFSLQTEHLIGLVEWQSQSLFTDFTDLREFFVYELYCLPKLIFGLRRSSES